MRVTIPILAATLLLVVYCYHHADFPRFSTATARPNILFILADDLGEQAWVSACPCRSTSTQPIYEFSDGLL